ncbi:YchJ family protein [Pelomonas sp. KK5]|uniref:YchJ family protein n=1 Tax=Pelomonas sp. KK5 TaxID=1855730 RepID=UPI00097C4C62|nr:YchJ family metal-binding protein [Pelomonas sp. KK5]
MTTPCPCGLPSSYESCCGRWHAAFAAGQGLQAPTAEALMRSRYSAFVLDLTGYLLATWHPSQRPQDLAPNEPALKWLGLEVKRHVPLDAEHALVEFVARCKLGGRASRMHETSRFVREDGAWYYVSAVISDGPG